ILDVATGTGEPGLTLAARVPQGEVTGTDLSEGMLRTAEANAAAKGLANFRTQTADVCALPFPGAAFDAVSCRMGFMFFPDMALAAREMARVLMPGGKFATTVWAAKERNPWMTTLLGSLSRILELPPPAPEAPGLFRCAGPGQLRALLQGAGFQEIAEREIAGEVVYGSAEHYWSIMNEVSGSASALLAKADPAKREQIRREVFAQIAKRAPFGPVRFEYAAILATARK
ncbi:MAG TPA: class I SAM-dependent methyltransferase, partial [Opitutaceae bacterium]|nr:class I SAM-dependent methyltransferase [Opitutaceae bacterium]